MDVSPKDTALVITDPQNDFLSPQGVTWPLVGDSVTENDTVAHLERLLQTAQQRGYGVFVSPHYYYPTDKGWQFGGTVEKMMHEINMFGRAGALTLDGFQGSGADWLDRFVITSYSIHYTKLYDRGQIEGVGRDRRGTG